MNGNQISPLESRIKELGDKSTQILIFLSFALVVVATLGSSPNLGPGQKAAMGLAMRCWLKAVYPVLLAILPVKEFKEGSLRWYRFVRTAKVVLLWVAIILILVGALEFGHAI